LVENHHKQERLGQIIWYESTKKIENSLLAEVKIHKQLIYIDKNFGKKMPIKKGPVLSDRPPWFPYGIG